MIRPEEGRGKEEEALPRGEGMAHVQDGIHRTPEFEPEAEVSDARRLTAGPLNPELKDELANSPILALVKEEVKVEAMEEEEDVKPVTADLKEPKTETTDVKNEESKRQDTLEKRLKGEDEKKERKSGSSGGEKRERSVSRDRESGRERERDRERQRERDKERERGKEKTREREKEKMEKSNEDSSKRKEEKLKKVELNPPAHSRSEHKSSTEAAGPKSNGEHKSSEVRTSEHKKSETAKSVDPKSSQNNEPKISERNPSDLRSEVRSLEHKSLETKSGEVKSSQNKSSEHKSNEVNTEQKTNEVMSSELKSSEVRSSEQKSSEMRSSSQNSSEMRSSEQKSSEVKSSEHKSSSERRHGEHRSSEQRRSEHRSSKEGRERREDGRERHRHRDREGRSRASIGIQCRRDKTVPKTLSSPPAPMDTSGGGPRCGHSMANPLRHLGNGERAYRFGHLMYVEVYPNGGAKVLHSWQDDLDRLSEEDNKQFAKEFTKEAFIEGTDGFAIYCCSIMHNAGRGLPDFLEYLGDEHSGLPVKHGVIGHPRELETTTMANYKDRVRENYKHGTFRFGHLDNLSLCGTAGEEAGGYFPDILDMLDEIPIVSQTLPWGEKSVLHDQLLRNKSNDGPILWIRPGEQSIPTGELGKSPLKRRRNQAINELHNLKYLPRSSVEREVVFEDRTPAHADHVGFGPDRMTTAAVGILKCVRCEDSHDYNRISKDTVIFAASSFYYLVEKLQMDLHEPPMSQSNNWLEEGKLNQLHREGVKYARVPLADNDIYFLPRNIIHQFRTVSATCSIAWHVRLSQYYLPPEGQALPPHTTPNPALVKTAVETGSSSEKENSSDLARSEKKRRREEEGAKEEKRRKREDEGGKGGDPDFKPKKEKTREEKEKERERRKEKEKREKDRKEGGGEHRHKTGEKEKKKREDKEERREEKKERTEKPREMKPSDTKDQLSFKVSDHVSNFEKLICETDSLSGGMLGLLNSSTAPRSHSNSPRKAGGEGPLASPRGDEERREKKDKSMSRLLFPNQLKSQETVKKKLSLDGPAPSPPPATCTPAEPTAPSSTNVNILDQIMNGMSQPSQAPKKD